MIARRDPPPRSFAMSLKNLRFPVSLCLLLLGLILVFLPAEARPVTAGRRVVVADNGKGHGIFSTLQALFASLWPGGGVPEKEGMSIDPDGAKIGATAAPGEEGMSIDPNGAN
jgi:hypothetical protein